MDRPSPSSRLIEAFAAAAPGPLTPEAESFVRQAEAQIEGEGVNDLPTTVLAGVLSDFWTFAETRELGVPTLRLRAAEGGLPYDRLEIVQTDRPFLVDSVMGELAAHGLEVRAMVHPVVAVARDPGGRRGGGALARESMILALIDHVGDDRREAVLQGLSGTLDDVRAAVEDFPAMLELMARSVEALRAGGAPNQAYDVEEQIAFLEWATRDRFVFLGARVYDYPRDEAGAYLREEPSFDPATGLGVLRDPARSVLRRASEPAFLSADARAYLADAPAVTVSKANLRSRVHRRAHMDYIGVRRYADDGSPVGETRFVGLFTAEAYEEPARTLPLLRRKVERALARLAGSPSSHAERRLRHIVETYPRDDLFQIDEDTLTATALGVLHLYDRPRVRLFVWRDVFDRFLSVLLYVPRERYHGDSARRAAQILAKAWGGRISAVHPRFADEPLARVHVVVGLDPGHHPEPDLAALEAEIEDALRTWGDRFQGAVRARGVHVGHTLARWRDAFPAGYRDRYGAAEALADLDAAARLIDDGEPVRVRPYRSSGDAETRLRFKLYLRPGPAPLSDVLPIVEHMGLKGLDEAAFPLSPAGQAEPVWVHDYLLEDASGEPIRFEAVAESFEQTLAAVWTGRTESDGFNRLVMELGVSWREAALVRALARWRQQTGLDPSQAVQEQALSDHPGVARLILDLFRAKFDPAVQVAPEDRKAKAEAVYAEIEAALQAVESLDADRVLRRLAQTVRGMTRTNYYQTGLDGSPKPYIAFKLASREIEALPAPRPFREIFVAGRQVEGVHLRFGPVARGGLRWSDRRDDFRTEVLALVRTQQVKNAVIVPVGAKGGFYPKRLPRDGGPEAVRAEAVEAYKTFLRGLLDLTDNLDADGAVVHPSGLAILDEDDPYLVVAADKGTATFSDIANGLAQAEAFWLGDAFASGGSHGYDHKEMGITARGAWESAKRHFRELGKDIQTEPFTCVGVGDMSGDVFGNGMLLSKATRLVAAFDHRHVFIDPDPDPEASWAERKRLFGLPRSSWTDYDPTLISKGGGVFPRTAKEIALSDEARALLGIEAQVVAPVELIRAVLGAEVEMLYFGGIGTYVKGPVESHADVGDKANDAIRLDAGELRAKVVVEGANLAMTQAGRIAFARGGGRINTDAIDNSAGVDTSDHEVNIKILLGRAIASGRLKPEARDPLLAEMTGEVAAHVLAHNYAQTLALSLAEAEAPAEIDAHANFVSELVAAGKLDRRVEGLPGPAAIAELKTRGLGLTRPELAVLLAYAKLELSAELVAGPAPDAPSFEDMLTDYVPTAHRPFEAEMRGHRLRREIIATSLSNAMVDMAGPTFAARLTSTLHCDAAHAATAFEAARRIFRLRSLWDEIAALDLKAPATAQRMLFQAVAGHLRAQAFWLAGHAAAPDGGLPGIQAMIDAYRPAVDALSRAGPDLLSDYDRGQVEARLAGFVEAGAPEALARRVADLMTTRMAVEVARVAESANWPAAAAGRLYHAAGAALGFDRLRGAAVALPTTDDFERRAVRQLLVSLVDEQTALTRQVAAGAPTDTAEAAHAAVAAWSAPRQAAVERSLRMLSDIEETGGWSFAKLTLAHAALREAAG